MFVRPASAEISAACVTSFDTRSSCVPEGGANGPPPSTLAPGALVDLGRDRLVDGGLSLAGSSDGGASAADSSPPSDTTSSAVLEQRSFAAEYVVCDELSAKRRVESARGRVSETPNAGRTVGSDSYALVSASGAGSCGAWRSASVATLGGGEARALRLR